MSPNAKNPRSAWMQEEVEAAVQPAARSVRWSAGVSTTSPIVMAVGAGRARRGSERAPEGVRGALCVVAPEAIDAELEPVSGALSIM